MTRRTLSHHLSGRSLLFPVEGWEEDESLSPCVETPLGTILMEGRLGERAGGLGRPSYSARSARGATWHRWELPQGQVELLIVDFHPRLPPGCLLERAVGIIWRLRANAGEVSSLQLLARRVPPGGEAGPESGEDLEAVAWYEDGVVMHMGTFDEAALWIRRRRPMAPPLPWPPDWHPGEVESGWVEMLPDGLLLTVPCWSGREAWQHHIALAWGSAGDDGDVTTWLVVDTTPEAILSGADLAENL